MSEPQFREYIVTRLDDGDQRFFKVCSALEDLSTALGENTRLTIEQRDDTADLVRILKFGSWGARIVKNGIEGTSKAIKVLWPIVAVIAAVLALYHDGKISWRDILEALK
jgi:hypothetical protein